ncbi:xylulokinase [Agrococcus sp. TSP3-2-1]|uniref:xylulokinase n=1 Tax=Agrococcus sp. TSP3-2-1 TaxID=2804583 RepID=UPI003CF8E19F
MSGELYVGVDVGTTATKALLVDAGGHVVARGRAVHESSISAGRVDPRCWWASAKAAVGQLGATRSRAVAIGISVHSPVLVPMDEDGEALCDGYRFDAPGLPGLVSAAATAMGPEVHARLGNPFTPATAIVVASRLFEREHGDRQEALRWLGSVGTVLGHRMTGKVAIDPSQASYYGCFDVVDGEDWLTAATSALGVPRELLPPVRPAGSPLGSLLPEVAELLGLPAGIRVSVAGGDTPSAAVAVGLDAEAGTLLTLGTTHVVTRFRTQPDGRNRRLLQRAHLEKGTWLAHGATNGGLALAVGLRDAVGARDGSVADAITAAARLDPAETATAPYSLPHVIPERGPLWMSEPAAGLVGVPEGATVDPQAAAWAVVEGVLFADRMVLGHVEGHDSSPIRVSADLSSGTEFVQLAADAFGRELRLVHESHLSALGAARHAAAAEGIQIPPASAERVVSPRSDRAALVEARWQAWRAHRASRVGL